MKQSNSVLLAKIKIVKWMLISTMWCSMTHTHLMVLSVVVAGVESRANVSQA